MSLASWQAMRVNCPRCGAEEGRPCMGKYRPRVSVHIERMGRRRKRKGLDSQVYFILASITNMLKIGTTEQFVGRRLRALQTGSPERLVLIATIPGDNTLERELHKRFVEYRRHGEWFEFVGELAGYVGSLQK